MNPETRYKLTALVFFFVLCTAFFLQFVHPYYVRHDSWPGKYSDPELGYNPYIFLLGLVATGLCLGMIVFYLPNRQKIKPWPLVGSVLLLVLLFCINYMNQPQNLDVETRDRILKHLGGLG